MIKETRMKRRSLLTFLSWLPLAGFAGPSVARVNTKGEELAGPLASLTYRQELSRLRYLNHDLLRVGRIRVDRAIAISDRICDLERKAYGLPAANETSEWVRQHEEMRLRWIHSYYTRRRAELRARCLELASLKP
jgi:hypothetical protein